MDVSDEVTVDDGVIVAEGKGVLEFPVCELPGGGGVWLFLLPPTAPGWRTSPARHPSMLIPGSGPVIRSAETPPVCLSHTVSGVAVCFLFWPSAYQRSPSFLLLGRLLAHTRPDYCDERYAEPSDLVLRSSPPLPSFPSPHEIYTRVHVSATPFEDVVWGQETNDQWCFPSPSPTLASFSTWGTACFATGMRSTSRFGEPQDPRETRAWPPRNLRIPLSVHRCCCPYIQAIRRGVHEQEQPSLHQPGATETRRVTTEPTWNTHHMQPWTNNDVVLCHSTISAYFWSHSCRQDAATRSSSVHPSVTLRAERAYPGGDGSLFPMRSTKIAPDLVEWFLCLGVPARRLWGIAPHPMMYLRPFVNRWVVGTVSKGMAENGLHRFIVSHGAIQDFLPQQAKLAGTPNCHPSQDTITGPVTFTGLDTITSLDTFAGSDTVTGPDIITFIRKENLDKNLRGRSWICPSPPCPTWNPNILFWFLFSFRVLNVMNVNAHQDHSLITKSSSNAIEQYFYFTIQDLMPNIFL